MRRYHSELTLLRRRLRLDWAVHSPVASRSWMLGPLGPIQLGPNGHRLYCYCVECVGWLARYRKHPPFGRRGRTSRTKWKRRARRDLTLKELAALLALDEWLDITEEDRGRHLQGSGGRRRLLRR